MTCSPTPRINTKKRKLLFPSWSLLLVHDIEWAFKLNSVSYSPLTTLSYTFQQIIGRNTQKWCNINISERNSRLNHISDKLTLSPLQTSKYIRIVNDGLTETPYDGKYGVIEP